MEKKKIYSVAYRMFPFETNDTTFIGIAIDSDTIILETGRIIKLVKENDKKRCRILKVSSIGDLEFLPSHLHECYLSNLAETDDVSKEQESLLFGKYEYYEKIREYGIKIDKLMAEAKGIMGEIERCKEKASFIELDEI